MKKFAFVILLLIPMISFGQAEKRYRSIIVDSLKALNGGRVDVKDTLLLDSLAQYNTDLSAQYTSRSLVDSAFVGTAIGTVGGNTIYNNDDNLAGDRIVTMGANSLTFSGNQTTFQGLNATSISDVLLLEDNVGTDLLTVQNDGNVGIGIVPDPITRLNIKTKSNGATTVGILISNSDNLKLLGVTEGGSIRMPGQVAIGHNNFPFGRLHILPDLVLNRPSLNIEQSVGPGTPDFLVSDAGNVLIGTTVPFVAGHSIEFRSKASTVIGLDGTFTMFISDSGAFAINKGSGLAFGGRFDATTNPTVFGVINATKESAVSGEFDGIMRFFVRGSGTVMTMNSSGRVGIGTETPDEKLRVNGNAIIDSSLATTARTTTLGVAATTFPVFSNVMTMTGDAGGNTIATITGANSGMILTMIFVDGNITITDDNTHAANSVDLSAAFTGADDTTLQIVFDGTSWYEISRSTN